MDYLSFDPTTCGFPKPRVPVLPGPSRHSFSVRRQAAAAALADSPNARFYSRGRYAMTDAYRLCGVGPDAMLLAPAYHCRTMLDPALRLGANVTLYPLNPDLSPNLQGLTACVTQHRGQIGALLVTHYFGFPQPLGPLLELCERHGIPLIEDCSHCLFLPSNSSDLGRKGRYCISSPYKFFPMEDGGVLWANHGAPLPTQRTQSPGIAQELKAVARAFRHTLAPRTTPAAELLETATTALADAPAPRGSDRQVTSTSPSHLYEMGDEHYGNLASSRSALRHTKLQRLQAQRRAHYRSWAQCVAHLPHCQALYPELPDGCTPYMFPLRIDEPDSHFFALKRLGVPIWRWDDMAVSGCSVATDFRTHLLHLPCHQELTDDHLRWMTTAVANVLTARGAASAETPSDS
jgi:perosamine synthetase